MRAFALVAIAALASQPAFARSADLQETARATILGSPAATLALSPAVATPADPRDMQTRVAASLSRPVLFNPRAHADPSAVALRADTAGLQDRVAQSIAPRVTFAATPVRMADAAATLQSDRLAAALGR